MLTKALPPPCLQSLPFFRLGVQPSQSRLFFRASKYRVNNSLAQILDIITTECKVLRSKKVFLG